MDFGTILSNIGFDWRVALANFANFLIIFFLLKRYAFASIKSALDERKLRIAKGLEDARRAETSLLMADQERDLTLERAREEANEIISLAKVQEETMIARARERAEQEAKHILRDADIKIQIKQEQMEQGIKVQTANIIASGIERILREKLGSDKMQEQVITSAIH
jgi:F-type H+-transporting ATPase subunit b